MSGLDTCSCGGLKRKQARRCMRCHLAKVAKERRDHSPPTPSKQSPGTCEVCGKPTSNGSRYSRCWQHRFYRVGVPASALPDAPPPPGPCHPGMRHVWEETDTTHERYRCANCLQPKVIRQAGPLRNKRHAPAKR